jgi:hypothetical protein
MPQRVPVLIVLFNVTGWQVVDTKTHLGKTRARIYAKTFNQVSPDVTYRAFVHHHEVANEIKAYWKELKTLGIPLDKAPEID